MDTEKILAAIGTLKKLIPEINDYMDLHAYEKADLETVLLAADHITQLQERFAASNTEAVELLATAIGDLNIAQSCRTCGNMTSYCSQNPDACKGYVWRGADRYKALKTREARTNG